MSKQMSKQMSEEMAEEIAEKVYYKTLLAYRAEKLALLKIRQECLKDIDEKISSLKKSFSEKCKHDDVDKIIRGCCSDDAVCQDCGKYVSRYHGFDTDWE